jgi:hypothetical protein
MTDCSLDAFIQLIKMMASTLLELSLKDGGM